MRITHASLNEEPGNAHREALDLRALVFELKSKANAPSIFAVEIAVSVHERDRYRTFVHSVSAQVQDLKADFADIVNCAKSDQSSLTNALGPLSSELKLFSPCQ